ncbi:rubredoxin-like domain-containing protein [Synergistes jonesii]|uniref:rubredoxin-like domain-containing protein n=1 Tax=Synergistes jonesii TaxID=2754 RepID=UPI003C6FF7AB
MLTRYEKEGEAILGNTGVYVCTICGFMFVGDSPPQICPVCKVPSWKFAAYVFMFALPGRRTPKTELSTRTNASAVVSVPMPMPMPMRVPAVPSPWYQRSCRPNSLKPISSRRR